jgi:hypothetical protein
MDPGTARDVGVFGRPNNAMQLTRGGWKRVEASSSTRGIVNHGKVVRPSQLIASVGPTVAKGARRRLRW